MNDHQNSWLAPAAVVLASLILLALWVRDSPDRRLVRRIPGADHTPDETDQASSNPVLRGVRTLGPGTPGTEPGSWPQFRGAQRDGAAHESIRLAREWGPAGPKQLWSTGVGEGYAGPVVDQGRVFLMDYDREKQQDALRCLSFADGRETWRFGYPVAVKRNHGMSRTVPALSSNLVVAMGPKCHVVCVDATTGELRWGLDLVREFGATVPPWYAGQCPLIDGDRVVLAPGGPDALLIAVGLTSGKLIWKTPNPAGWKMTHSSVVIAEAGGRRSYVYCASGGVVAASTTDGQLLWQTDAWKISIATVPSPVPLPGGRIFFSGGYNAGSLMLRIPGEAGPTAPTPEFRLKPEVFGATQHTPVFHQGHLFGVRPDGDFVCLDLEGKAIWTSGELRFGLGPFVVADGLIYAVDDSGRLSMFEATPSRFRLLGQTQVLKGREAWAPLAVAAGRLLLRDLTTLLCLDLAASR